MLPGMDSSVSAERTRLLHAGLLHAGLLVRALLVSALLASGLLACGSTGGNEEGELRGFPDPAQVLVPPCRVGDNCTGPMTNGSVTALAATSDGGAWLGLAFGDGSSAQGDSCTLGELSSQTRGDTIYGDGFLARVDALGVPELLLPLGDAGVTALLPLEDGSVVVAGTFYPTLMLGDQSWYYANFEANAFLARLEPDGTWGWVQTWAYAADRLTVNALALQGDTLLLTGLYWGTPELGGQTITPNDPYPGLLFVAKLDAQEGTFVSFETLGTGIPSGLTVGQDGAVFLSASASYQYGGQFKDTLLTYPEQWVARLDAGHEWQALVKTRSGVSVGGSAPLEVGDGRLLLTYWWSTASTPVMDGQLIFEGLPSLGMTIWSDGAIATLNRETGEWISARTSPYQDAWSQFSVASDGTIWGREEIVAYDYKGNKVLVSAGLCRFLSTGATVSCAFQLEYYRLGLLAASPGGVWFTTAPDDPEVPTVLKLEGG